MIYTVEMENDLKPSRTDYAVSIAKSIVGACPVAGALFAEIIQNVIPNQRIDRIVRLLQILDEKVKNIESKELENQFRDERFIDLLEDGFFAAARALLEQRRQYLASLIANSLTNKSLEYSQGKILLQLLNELSDPEVILLQYYTKDYDSDRKEFLETHKHALQGPIVTIGNWSQALADKETLHSTFGEHLLRLSLIEPRFEPVAQDKVPEFDEKTGMIKVRSYEITALGRLLLRFIGPNDGRS